MLATLLILCATACTVPYSDAVVPDFNEENFLQPPGQDDRIEHPYFPQLYEGQVYRYATGYTSFGSNTLETVIYTSTLRFNRHDFVYPTLVGAPAIPVTVLTHESTTPGYEFVTTRWYGEDNDGNVWDFGELRVGNYLASGGSPDVVDIRVGFLEGSSDVSGDGSDEPGFYLPVDMVDATNWVQQCAYRGDVAEPVGWFLEHEFFDEREFGEWGDGVYRRWSGFFPPSADSNELAAAQLWSGEEGYTEVGLVRKQQGPYTTVLTSIIPEPAAGMLWAWVLLLLQRTKR